MREPSGKLRMATHDERDRMLQVYFPVPGRMYNIPEMFQEENVEVSSLSLANVNLAVQLCIDDCK